MSHIHVYNPRSTTFLTLTMYAVLIIQNDQDKRRNNESPHHQNYTSYKDLNDKLSKQRIYFSKKAQKCEPRVGGHG